MTSFDPSAAILQIDDLQVAYPGEPPLVDGWSARIGAGVTLLQGDTGAGKSTLLRVLAGEQPATRGRLVLAGARFDAAADAYRRNVFFHGDPADDARLLPMTMAECTRALCGSDADARFDEPAWERLIDGFGLAPHRAKTMHMLSTGSRRKVVLAAALASGRALTLLDEPAGALDAASIRFLWQTLAGFSQAHPLRAVVVASGDTLDTMPFAARFTLPLRAR